MKNFLKEKIIFYENYLKKFFDFIEKGKKTIESIENKKEKILVDLKEDLNKINKNSNEIKIK